MTLRLASGRKLQGAIVDPVSGARVWAQGGKAAARELLAAHHERLERDLRPGPFFRPRRRRPKESALGGRPVSA